MPDEILSRVKLHELTLWTAQKLYPENKLSVFRIGLIAREIPHDASGSLSIARVASFSARAWSLVTVLLFSNESSQVKQRYPPTTVFCKLFVHRNKLMVSENLNSSRGAKIVLNDYSIHLRGFLLFTIFKRFCCCIFPPSPDLRATIL